jgi:hypothetical protein
MSETKNLLRALAAFSAEIEGIKKNAENEFSNYSYANLSAIFDQVKPKLKEHGLGFYQHLNHEHVVAGINPESGEEMQNLALFIKTTVYHVDSGESMTSKMRIQEGVELRGMNVYQSLGSAITYMRRYALASMLTLSTDDDNDAAGEQVNKKGAAKKSTSKNDQNDERPWLNLGTEAYEKAVEWLAQPDNKFEDIYTKYKVGNKVKDKLMEEAASMAQFNHENPDPQNG